ncbi:MAG: TRAP transporter large permease subunit, partial [Cyanobacteria bacterium HKST-UBA03]|nr:TRAP transporter large permease subunit [Cyanobacteria bacterium HKST-UBA03]
MSHSEEGPKSPTEQAAPIDLDAAFDALRDGAMDEAQQAQLQAIVEQEEKSTRQLPRLWAWLVSTLGIVMSGFYIYTAGTLPAPVQWQRGLYVLLTFVLIFLLYPTIPGATRLGRYLRRTATDGQLERGGLQPGLRLLLGNGRIPGIVDLILIALTLWVVGYYIAEFEALQKRAGAYNEMDFLIGVVGLLLSLEVSRRVLGWSMTIIGIVFVLYLRFGYVLYDWPVLEAFAHRGRAFDRVATILYFDQEGVFGVMANVLVTYVILFIFFGAFLRKSGASRFFIDLPLALAGRTVGGPAKVSVIASALFGSISGSAIANTVSTGAFTIPLMKRAGFKPHVAGAIEPAASIGGMFMPPVMGAGAFLMAEL